MAVVEEDGKAVRQRRGQGPYRVGLERGRGRGPGARLLLGRRRLLVVGASGHVHRGPGLVCPLLPLLLLLLLLLAAGGWHGLGLGRAALGADLLDTDQAELGAPVGGWVKSPSGLSRTPHERRKKKRRPPDACA